VDKAVATASASAAAVRLRVAGVAPAASASRLGEAEELLRELVDLLRPRRHVARAELRLEVDLGARMARGGHHQVEEPRDAYLRADVGMGELAEDLEQPVRLVERL